MIAAPVFARLKRACRAAVGLSGGVEGAAATCGKASSTSGNWNNRNLPDLPTLGDAFLLDEVAVMGGERPPIATALAAELGGVLIMLPEGARGPGELGLMLLEATHELGELAQTSRAALADGKVDGLEPAAIEAEADDLIERAVAIREYARLLQGKGAVRDVSDKREVG